MNDTACRIPVISAVMPCLNEERTLAACIGKAQGSFLRMGVLGEVVIADNGSTDNSCRVAESLGARVIHQPVKGYGAALMAGIEAARGEIVVMGDSDDSYDWSNIEPLISKVRQGYDVVIGNRFKGGIEPGAMPWHHRYFGNPVLSGIARWIYGLPIGDFHCGMRAFTRSAYLKMALQTPGMEFATEMIASASRAGLRIGEAPIRLFPDGRDRPPHLRSFRDGWRHLRFILTYAPDHLYLVPGAVMLVIGLLLQLILATGPVRIHGYYFGVHFLALGGLLSLVGFNVINMGLLSKMLMSLRFELFSTAIVRWALHRFKLEWGLLLGGGLVAVGAAVELFIFSLWLSSPGQPMEYSVHPAFVGAQMIALGINIAFASFLLRLITEHHASSLATRRASEGAISARKISKNGQLAL